jgi:hypothetical protein
MAPAEKHQYVERAKTAIHGALPGEKNEQTLFLMDHYLKLLGQASR